jgi:hypothetical protein
LEDVITTNKESSKKTAEEKIASEGSWVIKRGTLVPANSTLKSSHLFKLVAEKIPCSFLGAIRKDMKKKGISDNGVYMAHDSMGHPRYIGRGNVFTRLKIRFDSQPLELVYFSFFIVEDKQHEREIETIMIRTAGPMLAFNTRKKRQDISAGSIKDFEPGTVYYERQWKKGRVSSKSAEE